MSGPADGRIEVTIGIMPLNGKQRMWFTNLEDNFMMMKLN
jgi:hypothetical protein